MTTRVKIEELIREWADEDLNNVNQLLNTLEKRLYLSYEPSLPPNPGFWDRLEGWLGNMGEGETEAIKALFRLASELFYVGPDEFRELHRSAYHGAIARWLVDQENIDLLDADASKNLRSAVDATWFCPITDSMRINSFYNSNNIANKADFRPDWRSLAEFGDVKKIKNYCDEQGFKRLVLLEDFVGGGSQMRKAVEFAVTIPSIDVLVIPLIVCPKGLKLGHELVKAHACLGFEAVLSIPQGAFVASKAINGEAHHHEDLRQLACRTYARVAGGLSPGRDAPYHPLGFPHKDPTGGLVVMYSNTPNNTLPLIHWASESWMPLFPRNVRV